MSDTAKITSKRQLTIPAAIFKKAGLKVGENVAIYEENGKVTIQSMSNLIQEMAGSLSIPEDLKGIDLDEAIEKGKELYFSKRMNES